VETIKRQIMATYDCLVTGSKSHGRGLSLRPIGCTPVLWQWHYSVAAAAACDAL